MKTIVTTATTLALGITLMLDTGSVQAAEVEPADTSIDFDAAVKPQGFTFGQLAANVVGGAAGGAVGAAVTVALVGTPAAAPAALAGAAGGAVAGLVGNVLTQLTGFLPEQPYAESTYQPTAAWDAG